MSEPAAAYTPPVDQPPPLVAGASPYGGFWVRLAAHFVDGFIIWIGMVVVSIVWTLAAGGPDAGGMGVALIVVLFSLAQVYHAYFLSSAKMATPGKRLCGLYVTDLEGHRLGFGHALLRNVAAIASYLTLYIGFIMAAFTERKQALHDKIAGTLVHRQPGGSAVIVIVIVIAVFFVVFVIGVLAAIAIPAYQDYTVRAKMNEVMYVMSTAKVPIAEYAANKGEWPTTWQQVESAGGANPMNQIRETSRQYVEDIRIEQGGAIVASIRITGKQGVMSMVPKRTGDTVQWTCTSSPEIRRYMPLACRE